MTEPGNLPPAALQYWGVMESGVRDRLSTSDLWTLIRDQAEAAGLSNTGLHLTDFNTMRGMAVGVRNSAESLASARPDYSLDASMIGDVPWARPLAQMDALPMYQVRFEHQVMVDGELTTEWRTSMFRGSLPATVGDLADELDQDGQQMADNYGQEHVGIGAVSVLRV